MKKKWYEILDSIRFAITVLLIGYLFIGIGNIQSKNEIIQKILLIFSTSGLLLKNLFPLVLTLNYVGSNKKDVIPFIGAFMCYILMNIITMILSKTTFSSEFYRNILGLAISDNMRPLNLGIVGSVAVIFTVDIAYDISRKRYNYGFLTFLDNDAWFFIVALIFTSLVSVGINYSYIYFVNVVNKLMEFISLNSTNPTALFIYGIFQRIGEMLHVDNIFKNNFLFGNLGGSWIDGKQVVYNGDINIWTAQMLSDSISAGTGKYTAGAYIINLFAAPSLIIGYYLNITDKIDRSRMLGMLLLGIMASVLTASPLPIEIVVFLTSPLLYAIHLILCGSIYMICSLLNICIGVMLSTSQATVTVGNIFEFIHYYSIVNLHPVLVKALIVGIVTFIIYQVVVFVYYHLLAQDFLDSEQGKIELKQFIDNLGGLTNIKKITSSSVAITVVLYDRDKLNVDGLLAGRAYKIIERYYGFIINYGSGSSTVCRKIRKEIKNYQDCLAYSKK